MDEELQQYGRVVDEATDLDFRPASELLLAVITLPMLFWATLYAVTGHERLYATHEARMRLYWKLLALEVVSVGIVVAWWYWFVA